MKICYAPSDFDGPGFYRCLSPGNQLSKNGVDVFMPKYEIKNGKAWFNVDFEMPTSADLYVWQQWKERFVAEEGLNRIRKMGSAIAIEVDDNYVNLPEYNPAFYGAHPYARDDGTILNRARRRKVRMPGGKSPLSKEARMLLGQKNFAPVPPNKHNYRHMLNAIRCADLLTVSTPFLADVYAPYNNNIQVIRNYLDWEMWEDITPQYEVERDRLRIGYLAKFGYRRADLQVIRDVVYRFMRNHPEVDFVATDVETHDYLGVPEEQRITIGGYHFYDIENQAFPMPEKTAVMDIGLVPLAMNDLNQGKSHLKGMEYNAAGIPFIASPTESYADYWIKQGRGANGFIAHDEKQWYECMELLVSDEKIRESTGYVGRLVAAENTIQRHWGEWYDTYYDLAGGVFKQTARKAITMGSVQKHSELGPLLKIVHEKRPKTIVEIGTAGGGTFWALAQVASDDTMLVSIDIPAGSPIDMRNGKDVYQRVERDWLKQFIKPTQRLRLIDMDSQQPVTFAVLKEALAGMEIDVLFIDGDHRYEGVKHDYETYSQLVRPGGIIAFHDIVTHEDKRVGVHKLWAEIKADNPDKTEEFVGPETWGYTPWGGIGVVYK